MERVPAGSAQRRRDVEIARVLRPIEVEPFAARAIEQLVAPVGVEIADDRRQAVGQQPELVAMLANGAFAFHFFGNVGMHRNHAAIARAAFRYPPPDAAGAFDVDHAPPDLPVGGAPFEPDALTVAISRKQTKLDRGDAERLERRAGHDPVRDQFVEFDVSVIEENQTVAGIVKGDAIANAVECIARHGIEAFLVPLAKHLVLSLELRDPPPEAVDFAPQFIDGWLIGQHLAPPGAHPALRITPPGPVAPVSRARRRPGTAASSPPVSCARGPRSSPGAAWRR